MRARVEGEESVRVIPVVHLRGDNSLIRMLRGEIKKSRQI